MKPVKPMTNDEMLAMCRGLVTHTPMVAIPTIDMAKLATRISAELEREEDSPSSMLLHLQQQIETLNQLATALEKQVVTRQLESSPIPRRWDRWFAAASAVCLLGVLVLTYGTGSINAEPVRKLQRDLSTAEHALQQLRDLGYLTPFSLHIDPETNKPVPFVRARPNELQFLGTIYPNVVERVEIWWTENQEKPEVIYPSATIPKSDEQRPVRLTTRHVYPLDGLIVRPRVKAIPKDAVLSKIHQEGLARLDVTASFVAAPWGMEPSETAVAPFPDYAIAREWIQRGGTLTIVQPQNTKQPVQLDHDKVDTLPINLRLFKLNMEGHTNFGDDDLVKLIPLRALNHLAVSSSSVTNAGCKHLPKFRQIRYLYLADTKITDEAVPDLLQMPLLNNLSIADNKGITDVGLMKLADLKTLAWLDVSRTGVTLDGLKKFQAARPDCTVMSEGIVK